MTANLTIIGSDTPLPVGEVVSTGRVSDLAGQPHRVAFRVVRVATFDEWDAQRTPEMRAAWPGHEGAHYYAVAMD